MNKKRDSEGRAGSPSVAATTVPQMSPTTAAFARTPVRVWHTGSLAQRLPFGAAECLRLLPAPTRPGRARPAAGASHSRAGQTRTPAPFSWRRWTSDSGRTAAARSCRPRSGPGPVQRPLLACRDISLRRRRDIGLSRLSPWCQRLQTKPSPCRCSTRVCPDDPAASIPL